VPPEEPGSFPAVSGPPETRDQCCCHAEARGQPLAERVGEAGECANLFFLPSSFPDYVHGQIEITVKRNETVHLRDIKAHVEQSLAVP
jgi:hypothetical protein